MTHKYKITLEFESEVPVKKHPNDLTQFENALPYLVDGDINNAYVYGSGKFKLKKEGK